jgi:hypothetical protein
VTVFLFQAVLGQQVPQHDVGQLIKMLTTAKQTAIMGLRKKLFSKLDYPEKYTLFTFGLLM